MVFRARIPVASQVTALEIWLLACILLVFGALGEYAFILRQVIQLSRKVRRKQERGECYSSQGILQNHDFDGNHDNSYQIPPSLPPNSLEVFSPNAGLLSKQHHGGVYDPKHEVHDSSGNGNRPATINQGREGTLFEDQYNNGPSTQVNYYLYFDHILRFLSGNDFWSTSRLKLLPRLCWFLGERNRANKSEDFDKKNCNFSSCKDQSASA